MVIAAENVQRRDASVDGYFSIFLHFNPLNLWKISAKLPGNSIIPGVQVPTFGLTNFGFAQHSIGAGCKIHRRIQTEFVKMDAYRQLDDSILYWLRLIGLWLGMDIFDPEYRPSWQTVITVAAAGITCLFTVYTALFCDGYIAVGANACMRFSAKVNKVLLHGSSKKQNID